MLYLILTAVKSFVKLQIWKNYKFTQVYIIDMIFGKSVILEAKFVYYRLFIIKKNCPLWVEFSTNAYCLFSRSFHII